MELTTGQRRLVFVVIVLAVVGLGAYLIEGRSSGGPPSAAPAPTPSPSAPAPSTSAPAPAQTLPATVPAATPVSTAGGAEIYQWLPFSATDLAAAVQATTTFSADYVNWSYHESGTAYVAKLASVTDSTYLTSLKIGYETPNIAKQRTETKQVSTGSGSIQSITSFSGTGPSITFVVSITEKLTSTQPVKTSTSQYSVTVVEQGTTWQVDNLQPVSAGNN